MVLNQEIAKGEIIRKFSFPKVKYVGIVCFYLSKILFNLGALSPYLYLHISKIILEDLKTYLEDLKLTWRYAKSLEDYYVVADAEGFVFE